MNTTALYSERLNRYVTALRNEKPDRIPIRPFVAEFTASYAGYTCQEITHDYDKAFAAVLKCAADFDWDAVVSNMVWVWTGLTEAIGLRYYGVPGIHVGPDVAFQYREPPPEQAFMRADEYDALIDDPTGFLYDVWLPRVSGDVVAPGQPATRRHALALVKGGMAMWKYFSAYGPHHARLRAECGTVPAIAGILKAPFDILADKLRGYVGLTRDMFVQPRKVLAACEALMPHLLHVARAGADPARQVPIGFWMHRGCVPFVRPEQFASHYWPTLRPILQELWAHGHQTLFYAEGDWSHHLDQFAELPERSIVYHVDRGDMVTVHRKLGHKFCLSGGIPNHLLAFGSPDDVRAACKKVIDGVARDGGYLMDASAIIQNDARVENIRALTDFTREYGVYSTGHAGDPGDGPRAERGETPATARAPRGRRDPGVCVPWAEKAGDLPPLSGDPDLVRRIWEDIDDLGHTFIWHCLLSF
ncbi:MAG TPA: uroporphyrinogen decarboxylase family protein [Phycisphaerae bacterium]|nr:uroporphyrinogen decarboxylase family protein [Phycisphaerae bacterium]HNU44182.1 uroporphyrinogen decarboxylase family protein [Phycisphaerae bacterium]